MPRRQKLELTWIGKENRPRLEPRILLEDPEHSYHAEHRVTENDHFDNVLIHGDNLLALKALEADYAGKVKCVCIDPPYNTGSAFTHYDDGVEHSLWLSLMRHRLEIMRNLLSDDGTLWVFVDDNEAHYLKVMLDELFGRGNFVANVIWQKVYSARMDATRFSSSHDHVLVYGKTDAAKINRLEVEQNVKQFNHVDENTGVRYRRRSLRKEGSKSLRSDRPTMYYPIYAPDGTPVYPIKSNGQEGRWRWSSDTYEERKDSGILEWVNRGGDWSVYVKQFLDDSAKRPPETLWTQEEVGHTHEAKQEVQALNPEDPFPTPKPERVIERILTIATDPGDLVLDSFAGSGTTGAVAHKMGRRWIMVELHDHAFTHIVPRLEKVIDGEDEGGVTESAAWKGGGGFRTYRLAPSLMKKDRWGQWVVNPDYNAEMLAEALCKHEGFTYAPSDEHFWMHGHSTESDFVYVTTQTLTADQLRFIVDEVGPDRTLLVLCAAWRGDETDFPNLTLKKIPNAVLDRCEWGRDDYSLNVAELPPAPPELDREPADEPNALPLFNQTAETTA